MDSKLISIVIAAILVFNLIAIGIPAAFENGLAQQDDGIATQAQQDEI
jgi:hypothetical protein